MNANAEGHKEVGHAYWRPRPGFAVFIRAAVLVSPVILSVAFAIVIEDLISEPVRAAAKAAWWIGVLGATVLVYLGSQRLVRHALPFATLLSMGMLFPGAAPDRLAIARTVARPRTLERVLDETRAPSESNRPVAAAQGVVALAASLSSHDRKTSGHAQRVRSLADMIGDQLGLPGEERERLRFVAFVHDVGKLAVSAQILDKDGSLTEEECRLVRSHSVEGARIIAPLGAWLGPWARAISDHHERYDGTGYPDGLAGEAISLGGRILAVADAYDVMTSARSYKSPVSAQAARMELARCAGSEFDPAIVRAFLAIPEQRLHGLLPASVLGALTFGDSSTASATLGRFAAATVACLAVGGFTAIGAGGPAPSDHPDIAAMPLRLPTGETIGSTLAKQAKGVRGSPVSSYLDPSNRRNGSSGAGGGVQGGDGSAGDNSPGTSSTTETVPSSSASTMSSNVDPGTTIPPTSTTQGTSPSTTAPPPSTTTPPPPPTTAPPPAPPTDLNATAGCQTLGFLPPASVTLTWQRSSTRGVTYDVMEREQDGYTYVAQDLPAGTTSYTVSDLDSGTQYTFEVWAMNSSGKSAASQPKSVTPECL